jgi:hypothetical protein
MTADVAPKYSLGPDVHVRAFDSELVVLNLRSGQYFALDAIGSEVWKELLAGNSPDGIAQGIHSRYRVDMQRAREDVCNLVDELLGEGLLVVGGQQR